jgi:hypothetical protein
MTNEELKQKQVIDLSTNSWLREICMQLIALNENLEKQDKPAKPKKVA